MTKHDTSTETNRRADLPPTTDQLDAVLQAAWCMGRDAAAMAAFIICAETRHVTLGCAAEDKIRAMTPPADLATRAMKGGEE